MNGPAASRGSAEFPQEVHDFVKFQEGPLDFLND